MVVALSVVNSSSVELLAPPCLCLGSLGDSGGGVDHHRQYQPHLHRRHHHYHHVVLNRNGVPRPLKLMSPFHDSWHAWRVERASSVSRRCSKKRWRDRGLVVINEIAGQYDDDFEDVKTQLLNYFTYKAVRTVLGQLHEMNPQKYRWFYDFVASNKPGDGKKFIRILVKEKQDLAERVMVTRLHLYGKWIKKCNHAEIYQEISDENLELMRERLKETVIWPSDDTNTGQF